jgi:membrane protease YdiL (CAAX protease family)
MTAPSTAAPDRPLWRAIWDFPLVALLVAAVLTAGTIALLGWALVLLPLPVDEQWGGAVRTIIAVTGLFALYKLVLRHLGERKHDDLPLAGGLRDLGLGTLGAFALMSLIVGIAAVLGVYRIEGWGGLSNWVPLLFSAGISAGFVEELVFRGILFRWVEEFAGSWAALALTSALFGLAHIANDNASWFSSFAIAMEAGVLLGGAYMLTRSLWAPIGLHFGWNMTQGLVWDVPVSGNEVDGLVQAQLIGNELLSGGAFGLEASLIALIVATMFGVWLVKLAAERGKVMRPWWVRRRLAAQ